MALLLRCLRDVRTRSGDPDLLPPLEGGDAPIANCVPGNRGEPSDRSRSVIDEVRAMPGGDPRQEAWGAHPRGSRSTVPKLSLVAIGSTRELPEECRQSDDAMNGD
jgi:hypothetical protein